MSEFPGTSEDYGNGQSPEWLGRIEDRMSELADQQFQIAQAFQTQQDYEDAWDDDEYEGLDEEEWADEEEGETEQPDIFDAITQSVDQRLAQASEEEGVAERDQDFEELKQAFPMLDDPGMAEYVVGRGLAIAHATNPDIIDSPAFVDLLADISRAVLMERQSPVVPPLNDNGSPPLYRQAPQVALEASGGGGTPHRSGGPPEVDHQANVVAAYHDLAPDI